MSTGLAGARGSSVAFVSAAAASMTVLGGQSQHEERRGVLLLIGADLARRLPVGRPKGAKRPTHGTYWLDRGLEQRLGVGLVSGGFDLGALLPGEARAEPPAGELLPYTQKRALGLFFAS